MVTGTVKWFNPTKGYGSFSHQAARAAGTCSSTSRLLSMPA